MLLKLWWRLDFLKKNFFLYKWDFLELDRRGGGGGGGHSVVLEAPLNVKFWTTALWIYSNVNLNHFSWNIPDQKKNKKKHKLKT